MKRQDSDFRLYVGLLGLTRGSMLYHSAYYDSIYFHVGKKESDKMSIFSIVLSQDETLGWR